MQTVTFLIYTFGVSANFPFGAEPENLTDDASRWQGKREENDRYS